MDDLFLDVLKANQEAQTHIDKNKISSLENRKIINEKKLEMDEAFLLKVNDFENEISTESEITLNALKTQQASVLEREKEEFKELFLQKSQEMRADLLKKIVFDHGQ